MAKNLKNKIVIALKRITLRTKGVKIYNNTVFSGVYFLGKAKIEPYCRLIGDPKITIGNNFYLNSGCHLLGEITFGNDVMIGPKTVIWGRDHGMEHGVPMNKQAHINAPIIVGNDVWIGANVTILKGVTIGNGAVIGAGSVVIKNVEDNSIVVGNPAKHIKFR